MAECKPSEKSPTGDVDLTSISSILNILLGAFSIFQKSAQTVPPPLMLIGKNVRPGMSARNLAARTISRLESEGGIAMGNIFSDGPNGNSLMIKTVAEEFVSMIQTEMVVETNVSPGAIQITATGTAGPIPVVVQGSNTGTFQAKGGAY